MSENITIKIEPIDFEPEAPVANEKDPEFINIKAELDDTEKDNTPKDTTEHLETVVKAEAVGLCVVKAEPEENDFIIPDIGAPQGPITSVDGVTDDDLSLHAVDNGRYICPVCCRTFATKGHIYKHSILHSRQKLECHICLTRFNALEDYETHLNEHCRKFPCTDCGKRFLSSSNLQQHKKIHLDVKPYKCEKCSRAFAVKANLQRHQKSVGCKTPTEPELTCNVCDKVFIKECLLKSHLRRHTTEKPFHCEMCDMQFKYKSTLVRHIQVHNDIRPYSCQFCNKQFTHSGLLKPHLRKHTGEKPYTCPTCKKQFAHKHNMLRHTLRHNREKNLECQLCHKVFPRESRLIYHMRSHTNSKPFKCDVCGRKFSHKHNVLRHYQRKHPNETYVAKYTDATVAKQVWQKVQQKLSEADV
ncbi:unnamed protein product [Colias eurytheme]|nr:unnamed protein product [Colias eurytheme]